MNKPKPTFSDLAAEYITLWNGAIIDASKVDKVTEIANNLQSNQPKYDLVSAKTGVPWFVVGLIHSLEASFSFTTHLHNGDPLGARTIHDPSGRPLTLPLNDWVHSAVDALGMKGLQNVDPGAWTIERTA